MNGIKLCFILYILIFGLFSCKKNGESSPIQAVVLSNGDKINVVSPIDGKILASSPLKMKFATHVREGRFFAQNEKGYYDLYALDGDQVKKMGETYSYVSDFYDGVSVVCCPNGSVKLINDSGEMIKDLSTIDGVKTKFVTRFKHGYATFVNMNSVSGIINTKGDVIIPATHQEYCSIISLNDNVYFEDGEKETVIIKDEKNNTLNELKNSKDVEYEAISTCNQNISAYFLKSDKNGSKCIIDCFGNEVVQLTSDVRYVTYIGKDYYVYENENFDSFICNLQGGEISSAKYTTVQPIETEGNTLFIVHENKEYKLIDHAGNQINKGKIASDDATYLGNNLLLVMNENPFDGGIIININDGKLVGNMPGKIKPFPEDGYSDVYNDKYTLAETIAERIGVSFIDGSIDDIYEDVDPSDIHSRTKGTVYPLLVASNIKKKGYEPQIEWLTDGGMNVSYQRDWRGFSCEYTNICNYQYLESSGIPVLNTELEATAIAQIDLDKSSVKVSGKEVLEALKKFIKNEIDVEVKADEPNYFAAVIKSYSSKGRSIFIHTRYSTLNYMYIPTEKIDSYLADAND